MREVAIIGVGMTEFGELWDKSLRDLLVESSLKAMDDAKVDAVDAIYVGAMSSGLFDNQEHLASIAADYLGMVGVPATRCESACISGSLAFKGAFLDVASGYSDIVLVTGVEKMTDVSGDKAVAGLSTAADDEFEGYNGVTFPGLYAMIANAHMKKYGTTRRQLSLVAVKNHANALKNPNAQFRMKVTPEAVEGSVMIADPLHILDCSPITDGAASVVVAPLELAKEKFAHHKIVKVIGLGHATGTIALHSREDITELDAVVKAGERAYKMAGLGPDDIDFAELHDCFTIAEICELEALGFCAKGEGGLMTERGETLPDGKIPINISGGLKAKGHPVGATGVSQIIELVEQIRGDAGDRQLKKADIGLAQNLGGSGGSSIVTILKGLGSRV
ncbi:thiolase domain-containing protein [bacterium]|nr:MAG: thiolase domain-containing protein [bacterium]